MLNQNYPNAFLFKIISKCNDSCDFCLEYEFIKANRPCLTFSEFKNNYEYLKKRFNPEYIILTGGEPTLHSDFLRMLKFLKERGDGFRFITNLLRFGDYKFVEQVREIFSDFNDLKQKKLSKIIASINDLPSKDRISEQRYEGLKNLFKARLPLVISVLIYKGNLEHLANLSGILKDLIEKDKTKRSFHVEFRLMYIEGVLDELLKISLPTDYRKLKLTVEKCIDILHTPRIKATLWNFPLCYIDNYAKAKNDSIPERQARRLIKIHKDGQLDKFEVRDWEQYLKSRNECKVCALKKYCSGVDPIYIDKYGFPDLKRF